MGFTAQRCGGHALRQPAVRFLLSCPALRQKSPDFLELRRAHVAAAGLDLYGLGCDAAAAYLSVGAASAADLNALWADRKTVMVKHFRFDRLSVLPAAALDCAAGCCAGGRRSLFAESGGADHYRTLAAALAAFCKSYRLSAGGTLPQAASPVRFDSDTVLYL